MLNLETEKDTSSNLAQSDGFKTCGMSVILVQDIPLDKVNVQKLVRKPINDHALSLRHFIVV